jgi:predicted glycosyltransferase involved in capsule biosynthesis
MTEKEIIHFIECEKNDSDYYRRKFSNREFYEKLRHESYDMAIKALKTIKELKAEMKSTKNDADNFTDQNYQTGYISAISTLEGYLAILENGGGEDEIYNEE